MISANVIEMKTCCKCGAPARERELFYQDKLVDTFDACKSCISEITDRLARVRSIFEAMLEAGIDYDLANATMTFLLDRLDK